MKQYIGLSISPFRDITLTKTTPASTQEVVYGINATPLYTVPAGRTAKITFMTIPTAVVVGGTQAGSSSQRTGYIKINSTSAVADVNLLPTNITDIGDKQVYLSAGTSLYAFASAIFSNHASDGVGTTLILRHSIFMCFIEEYEG